jgi:hypothetical protein
MTDRPSWAGLMGHKMSMFGRFGWFGPFFLFFSLYFLIPFVELISSSDLIKHGQNISRKYILQS